MGRFHGVINTEEGSEIIHQYKSNKGLGGKSLEIEKLQEIFEGEAEEKMPVIHITIDNSGKSALAPKIIKKSSKERYQCPACYGADWPKSQQIEACPECAQPIDTRFY